MKQSIKYALLIGGLILAGASCGLKPPQAVEAPTEDSKEQIADLIEQNKKLKEQNEDLKDKMDEAEEKKNSMKEDAKNDEAMKDDEEKMTDSDTSDGFKFDEKSEELQKIEDISLEVGENSVLILLSAELDEYTGENKYAAFGCRDVLVAKEIELEEKEMSDLAHAIVELLTIKKDTYEEEGLTNAVAGIGITLDNIRYEDGKRVVEFVGERNVFGACQLDQAYRQLEETIRYYSPDATILLNGSEEEWNDIAQP